MAKKRAIGIRWLRPGTARPLGIDGKPDATLVYDGRPQKVRMP
jgi:hypothetical protein